MRIAIVGAGPAGLTSAKQALAEGHEVTVYESTDDVGGIWNPGAGGAYESVRMQSSRLSFPFSDHPPPFDDDFPTLRQVHQYLRGYAERFGVLPLVRFGSRVTRMVKDGAEWSVTAETGAAASTGAYDAVMVASGELWLPRMPEFLPAPSTGVRVLSAKDYRSPGALAGAKVLVVGGGVSGADIASELVGVATTVKWSVRHRQLFLPRMCGHVYNDELFSYVGRVGVEDMSYAAWLDFLGELMPEYFAAYRASGLLPDEGFHHAVHINDTIIPAVAAGSIEVRPAFDRFEPDGTVVFTDASRERYDAVVLCLGYGLPDYSFLADFRREDLYEHHVYWRDSSLAVVNTPVDTEAFGTACPYFEAIAGWVLSVWSGKTELPAPAAMASWCEQHMGDLQDRRYFDCWLWTVRLGLESATLPDPATAFTDYWNVVASVTAPDNLRPTGAIARPAPYDKIVDLVGLKHRVLASLAPRVRDRLLNDGQITSGEHRAAAAVPPDRVLAPSLPYRERR
ncbi:FAD-dependent oxidoreductase [Actinoplanes sp. NPDC051475]|uniref:FAD-dependent oxidoreductase n=1 Tax=Actinoplanes sp. NPDC051475 TaxID=3157225 RepID=UPI00344D02A1